MIKLVIVPDLKIRLSSHSLNGIISKRKKRKKESTSSAEMTNGNGGSFDRLKVRNVCYISFPFFSFFLKWCTSIGAIKHPWAPQARCSFCENETRSDMAVLRQSNSHARPRTQRSPCGVERRASSVKRRGKNKRQPLAFLDLGQSANGANPDGCAKEQPLKILRAADIILLECSET